MAVTMRDSDVAKIEQYKQDYANATTDAEREAAHAAAEAIRASYGFSGGVDGSESISLKPSNYGGSSTSVGTYTPEQQAIVDQMNANSQKWYDVDTWQEQEALHQQNQQLAAQLGGSVSYDPATGYWSGSAAPTLKQQQQQQSSGLDLNALLDKWHGYAPDVDQSKADQAALLEQWRNSATEQANNKIDYGVDQAVTALERAEADAQAQFKEQQESVDRDAAMAKDNAALYAELRGDKGGIGQEQYNEIQNTQAQNHLAVQQAQTKLSTDTARQIADLRAQGEFEKADAALEISQQYLSQLINLEQWAAEFGLSVAQFQVSLDQWALNYELAMEELQLAKDQFATSVDQWQQSFDAANSQWQQEFDLNTNKWLESLKENTEVSVSGISGKTDVELYEYLYKSGYTNKHENTIKAYLMGQGMTATEAAAVAQAYVNEQYKNLASAPSPSVDPDVEEADIAEVQYTEANYKALLNELSAIEDRGVNVAQKALAKIQSYRDQNKISYEQYLKLLSQYGLV